MEYNREIKEIDVYTEVDYFELINYRCNSSNTYTFISKNNQQIQIYKYLLQKRIEQKKEEYLQKRLKLIEMPTDEKEKEIVLKNMIIFI
tara:strand:+ start:1111 stop:1377 length:267 start_codon:yes stop_codon:yes gene_type:complete